MQSGFNIVERDASEYSIKGFSGEVTRYAQESGVSYPYFMLYGPVAMYKLSLLKEMFERTLADSVDNASGNVTEQLDTAKPITVYYNQSGTVLKLGKLQPRQVKIFLSLFKEEKIQGALSAEKNDLPRQYLYAFWECT